ncbi:hypothetical protein [Paenibacillus sp. MBLB4367]|uniref:hypothetical protein n=1 Tax=Paenibacillus sp. MBLB4367 TaxID=3384767 RepID=UPI003907F588
MGNDWYYSVKIVMGSAYDGANDPEFVFNNEEKEKMIGFVDTCLENGHEISIVMEKLKEE